MISLARYRHVTPTTGAAGTAVPQLVLVMRHTTFALSFWVTPGAQAKGRTVSVDLASFQGSYQKQWTAATPCRD